MIQNLRGIILNVPQISDGCWDTWSQAQPKCHHRPEVCCQKCIKQEKIGKNAEKWMGNDGNMVNQFKFRDDIATICSTQGYQESAFPPELRLARCIALTSPVKSGTWPKPRREACNFAHHWNENLHYLYWQKDIANLLGVLHTLYLIYIYIYNHIYFLCTSNIYILYTCINQRGYKRCKHMLAKNTLAESRLETGCQPSTFSTQSTSTLPNLLPSVSIHFPAQQKNSC